MLYSCLEDVNCEKNGTLRIAEIWYQTLHEGKNSVLVQSNS